MRDTSCDERFRTQNAQNARQAPEEVDAIMVNLADQDTSFLVPCRHCGDLMPEQDRICPHCGKDQKAAFEQRSDGVGARVSGGSPGDGDVPDLLATAPGTDGFAPGGPGSPLADDGSARRRRKAFGVVALIAGVLLLGMAYDRYVKQSAATPPPASVPGTSSARPATVTGPVVTTPSGVASTPAAESAAAPPAPPTAAAPAAPAADPARSPCNEALAALALCTRP